MMFFGYTLHNMQYTTIHIATYLLKKSPQAQQTKKCLLRCEHKFVDY